MPHVIGTTISQQVQGWLLTTIVLALVSPAVSQTAVSNEPRAQRTLLVSIPDRKLAVLENGNVVADFSISVGAAKSPSPTGEFVVVNRVVNPTYYHEGVVIPAGKDNPVGTRWVGLSQKGYGIHGTNAPKSIGRAASHGCIRLHNRDMEKLFSLLRVGDVVQIRGERDEQIAEIFGGTPDGETEAAAQAASEPAGVVAASSF
jgi:lipoprotein-anchoring transpeptidase ErfK/SrfK